MVGPVNNGRLLQCREEDSSADTGDSVTNSLETN